MSYRAKLPTAAITRRIPSLRFHKGTGQYRVTFDGKDVWLGADPVAAQKRYAAAVAEWAARGCAAPAPPSDELKVAELADRYIADRKEYYAATPWNLSRVDDSLRDLLALYADLEAARLTPRHLKAVRQRMIDRGLSRAYINEQIGGVKRMLRWAAAEDMLPVEVYQRAATLEGLRKGFTTAPEGKRREPMTEAELEAVRPYLPAPVAAALELMLLTGARPSEVLTLRKRDINRDMDPWRVEVAVHKNAWRGQSRTLFIGPRGQRVLAPFLLRGDDEFLFSPAESYAETLRKRHEARTTPLSCGNVPGSNRTAHPKRSPGEVYEHAAFCRCITRAIERVNADRKARGEKDMLRRFTPYEARHGAATRIRAAMDLDAVQSVLGHAKVDMSAHYAHLHEGVASEVMRRLG